MKIRPKNIQVFQNGGVPQWYLDRYGNRTTLLNWNKNIDYSRSNKNLNTNDHRNAENLEKVYKKNIAYTGTPGAISSDILNFYNSDGKGMSAEEFVKFYNDNAEKIRQHWSKDLTYNARTAGEHNKLFRKMFNSRSDQSNDIRSEYNIGYQDNLENIEGSSTWLRRMDLYEHDFDFSNPDRNRLHEITLSNGDKAVVYKKANGDIGLFNTTEGTIENNPSNNSSNNSSSGNLSPNNTVSNNSKKSNSGTQVPTGHKEYGFNWDKLKNVASRIINNPDLYATGRLAGALLSNDRIYDEALKGILPTLNLTYNTHRQVVGDEATKLAYYKRAALGETKAKRAITSDLDKQLAYLMEAKRVGDELRALGDLADNQEIRRTSDESNQHQWANTQRATEVANANLASINQANSLRHNLLALKHSANWSSIDNFLQGIEYRKRQLLEKINAINDNLFALLLKDFLDNDLEYLNAYNSWQKVVKENTDSATGILENNETVRNARKAWNKALRDANRRLLQNLLNYNNLLFFAKSGTKVTYKKKDDLLYKSAKDTIEHFRKMSKLSSDALNRKRPKIEKLISHPKGSTKKYLLGGVAPFVVYKPVALGGETTTSSQTSTSSTSKSSGGSDGLDLLKELFKSLQTEGLPSDVTGIYKAMQSLMLQKEAFGDELSTEDIASAYIYQMQLINNVKFSKALFDLVAKTVLEKDAGSEYAIDLSGRLAVQDGETKRVAYKLVNNMKEGDVPLTNSDLLNLRAVAFPFDNNMLQVASNATSMKEISEFLKAQLPKIESTESVIEGYTKKGSEDIKEGLRSLLQDAPEGDYKYTKTIKDNLQLRALALDYLYKILPKNMKNLLEVNANLQGSNSKTLIEEMINAGAVLTTKTEFDAVTGKAAKDSNGNSKGSGDLGDMIPAVAFFLGLGDQKTFIILDKTQDGLKIDTISAPITKDNKNTGIITLDKLSESDFGGLLLINLATIGDSLIALNGFSNVLIGDRIYLTELPIDKEYAQKTGIIRPNLNFLKRIEQANEKLKLMGIDTKDSKNIPTINKVYQDFNLPILYTISNNKPVLSSEYARFAMVNATVSEKAFAEEPNFNDGIREASKREREQFESTMKTFEGNSKYSIDDGWGPFDWGKENLYVGVVYIPMVDSTISALGGTGFKASGDEYNKIETLQQQANYARKMGFKPGGNESNLK